MRKKSLVYILSSLIFISMFCFKCKKEDEAIKEYIGSIELNSQQAIDEFGAENYNVVVGYLKIRDTAINNIVSLLPLSSIREVGDMLSILSTYGLYSLHGLNNLTSVGSLNLQNNYHIDSLDGLNNLEIIEEEISIYNYRELRNLTGLRKFNSSRLEIISIGNNYRLESLEGLESVNTIDYVNIINNASMNSLHGLDNLQKVESFNCNNLPIISLEGLEGLTTITRNLNIESCNALVSLNGLNNLSEVEGYLRFSYNNSLTDYCALKPLILINSSTWTLMTVENAENPTMEEVVGGCHASTALSMPF